MEGQTKKAREIYPRQLKIQIAMEVMTGLKGVLEASRDYNIDRHVVSHWVKRFGSEVLKRQTKERVSSHSMETEKSTKNEAEFETQIQLLEEENKQLRKKLLESNLQAEALTTLIDLAEEHYGIPLRKNSGAKQSSE
jgi:transposase-like protein